MEEGESLMRSMSNARVFRYGLSRAGWIMLLLLVGLVAVFSLQGMFFELAASDSDALTGVLFIVLVFGGILLPVPLMEFLWWARGRVAVDATGLRWRGWSTWNDRAWGEVLAVGLPAPDAGRSDDERIHVVTEDDYEFIHGYGLRAREALREAIRSYGDLDQIEVIGNHTFLCRPGAVDTVKQRAQGNVDPPHDEGLDFLAGRFRRF